jgi:signal transduction histidine kinase/ligand-binding sensor domain-containing protein
MLRRAWLCLACLSLFPEPARALDPSKHLSQYAHAAWRVQDGFFRGTPFEITQTGDGYLWVGSSTGLLRFDGIRFVPWTPEHGARLPGARIVRLVTGRDGSLWIATNGGVSHWKNGTLTNYSTGPAGAYAMFEDSRGQVWLGQPLLPETPQPLCRIIDLQRPCVSVPTVPPIQGITAIAEDAHGDVWIGGSTTLVRWSGGSPTVYGPTGLKNNSASGVEAIVAMADGTLWVGIAKAGPGLGLQRLAQGHWQSFKTPELDGDSLIVTALRLDRDGALLVGTADRGLYRLHDRSVDHVDSMSGLSGDFVQALTEDREGNVWVSTDQGVDRFSDTPVVSFSSREGLCSTEVQSVMAGRDGSVWVGGDSGLSRLRNGRVSCIRSGHGLPGTQVTSLLEDHAGRLWVGIDNDLWIYEHDAFRRVAKPDGSAIGFVFGLAEDAEHRIWVTAGGTPRRLLRIDGSNVQEELHDKSPRRVAADPTGGVWLGMVNGELAHYKDGTLVSYRFPHETPGTAQQLLAGPDGSILGATTFGLVGWYNGKQFMLTPKNGLPCDSVYAMSYDARGNLWLFMDCAIGEVIAADLVNLRSNPEAQISMRTLDVFDGVHTGYPSFDAGARSTDGRLWFAAKSQLQMIDPEHLRRNQVQPPVHVEQIVADRRHHPAGGIVRLPPLTRDLEIDYVALSFIAPQKVLFRYRLEGRDRTWQEPGTRRAAFYSDLRPGTYRFRVIASNNDGVWNEEGASADFVVAPTWYQSNSFLVLSIITGLAMVWTAYRIHMRQVARALNVRFDERLAERTRIARELHDTLLQSFHGLLFRFQAAINMLPDRPVDAKLKFESAIDQASQAIAEGRDAVQNLRASPQVTNDLAKALSAVADELTTAYGDDATDRSVIDVAVEGTPRELHPIVCADVYRIAAEALRNAYRHADARQIEVRIRYDDKQLGVRVQDDGKGIDAVIRCHERPGHFGLPGMRERAKVIGGSLDVWSEMSLGTAVDLTVPAAAAYATGRRQRAGRGLLERLAGRSTNT